MNKLIGLAAATLLVTGSVCAETIAEAENRLLEEAKSFKEHPLHEYMIPEGYSALSLVLINVGKRCRTEPDISSDECKSQRMAAVTQLKEYGFDNAEEEDFKNPQLWALSSELQEIYLSRLKALQKEKSRLTKQQRENYRAMTKEIDAMEGIKISKRMELKKAAKKKSELKELTEIEALYADYQKRPSELRKQLASRKNN